MGLFEQFSFLSLYIKVYIFSCTNENIESRSHHIDWILCRKLNSKIASLSTIATRTRCHLFFSNSETIIYPYQSACIQHDDTAYVKVSIRHFQYYNA